MGKRYIAALCMSVKGVVHAQRMYYVYIQCTLYMYIYT